MEEEKKLNSPETDHPSPEKSTSDDVTWLELTNKFKSRTAAGGKSPTRSNDAALREAARRIPTAGGPPPRYQTSNNSTSSFPPRKNEPNSPPRISPRIKPDDSTSLFQSFATFQQTSSQRRDNTNIITSSSGGDRNKFLDDNNVVDNSYEPLHERLISKPQHVQNDEREVVQYYQIVYRGVVS